MARGYRCLRRCGGCSWNRVRVWVRAGRWLESVPSSVSQRLDVFHRELRGEVLAKRAKLLFLGRGQLTPPFACSGECSLATSDPVNTSAPVGRWA